MAKAVFIIGWGRSGTTWLGNLLQQHPEISAVSGEEKGIFESVYFSEVEGRYDDIKSPCNYIELATVLSRSFYFRQAGANLDNLLARYPMSYTELFLDVMNTFASENDSSIWIEKTPGHTLIASRLAKRIPDASFILIKRDAKSVITSRLKILQVMKQHLGIRAGTVKTALKVAEWTLTRQQHLNRAEQVARKWPDRAISIRYEDLLADTEGAMRKACDFLDLEFDSATLESPYQANSTEKWMQGEAFKEPPSWMLGGWLDFWQRVGKITPAFLLTAVYWLGKTIAFGPRRLSLPFFFFEGLNGAPKTPDHDRW